MPPRVDDSSVHLLTEQQGRNATVATQGMSFRSVVRSMFLNLSAILRVLVHLRIFVGALDDSHTMNGEGNRSLCGTTHKETQLEHTNF